MRYKTFISRYIKIFPYLYVNMVRIFNLTDLYQPTYNKRNIPFIRSGFKIRDCDNRIFAIKGSVDFSKVASYLDIGSQLGYFVFSLSEIGKIPMGCGIEMDPIACSYANALISLSNTKNLSFFNSKFTVELARAIPAYDMISLLNVFHHMVYFDGFDVADAIMRQLYIKCNSYFIFETGQFNEKGYYWSDSLAFMGDDPENWTERYLSGLGYKKVILAGRFKNHLNDVKRAFYVCSK